MPGQGSTALEDFNNYFGTMYHFALDGGWYDVPICDMAIIPLVESNGMSAIITAKVCVCNQCGHRWIAEKPKKPYRCPSRKCRSIHWDDKKRKLKGRRK